MANVKELNINSTTYDIIGKGVVDNNNVSTPLKLWSGTKAQYDSIQTKDANTLYNITDDTTEIESLHNVGDIFYSMRAEDNLNGAVVCDGSSYAIADYSEGSQSVKTLLDSGKLPYVSISNFDAMVTAKGSCRCFGYDGSSTTTFKVPKLNNVFVECGTAATSSEFIDAGLPNITGELNSRANSGDYYGDITRGTGVFKVTKKGSSSTAAYSTVATNSATSVGDATTFDASRSSSIYGNSSTVQPKSVKYRAFIQLANGVSDSALQNVSTLMNIKNETADYVIEYQRPTSSNSYTWYRLYKSGWVEQGGIAYGTSSTTNKVINFPITMIDRNYTANTHAFEGAATSLCPIDAKIMETSTASKLEVLCCYTDGSTLHTWGGRFSWEVKGFAAQS